MARQYTREAIRNTFYYYYADIYAIIEEIFQMELQTVKEEYNDTLSWEESFLVAINFAIKKQKSDLSYLSFYSEGESRGVPLSCGW